ncbi:hypothetical protein SNOG_13830 [Parastagonospora nodorum SN15]|uniref:Uncharacterized protein n=1 Tax=Phaeosphaeria nodorum (strain SN15 / ATCC MYA-4574 / FGSC 10173) TaxID=321614 RepID=Q0U334_PHANO|nr:hypothetical protein SNOG_13830 [Parastagonospora nodorum SN15]EAT78854.1 hypothetical protein SNOG_13830 [Parastagonospora nodorum SN15]
MSRRYSRKFGRDARVLDAHGNVSGEHLRHPLQGSERLR